MDKIRIGKTIAVSWRVKVNGEVVDLTSMQFSLKVWSHARNIRLPYTLTAPNIVNFVWKAQDQHETGRYYLSLYKVNQPASIVDVPFVELVERSWSEDTFNDSDLQTEEIVISQGNMTLFGDYESLYNKPTINGDDFVGNINLYPKSEMDELLADKQDVIVDLDTIRSNAQAGKDARDVIPSLATKTEVNAKYTKPTNGIPKADLDSSVQSSLDKADSALQEHQDISQLATKAEVEAIKELSISVTNKKLKLKLL